MNTASRIESNGKPNYIHVSNEFANLLIEAGKAGWLTRREEVIVAKGKGELTTWWLHPEKGVSSAGSSCSDESSTGGISDADDDECSELNEEIDGLDPHIQHLIDWNARCLVDKLKFIVAQRNPGKQGAVDAVVTPKVVSQVKLFVVGIAQRYRSGTDCPFHNFDHVRKTRT